MKVPQQDPKDDTGPYFLYAEKAQDGNQLRAWSPGRGVFFQLNDRLPSGELCFAVSVDHAAGTLLVAVHGLELRNFLRDIGILNDFKSHLDLNDVLNSYEAISRQFSTLKTHSGTDLSSNQAQGSVAEIELFVEGLLKERDIFEQFQFEHIHANGLLKQEHWQQMMQSSALKDLVNVDDAVDLGHSMPIQRANEPQNPELIKTFLASIQRGDVEAVRQFLTTDLVAVDSTAIEASLELVDLDIFWILLEQANSVTDALYAAALHGHSRAVKDFVQRMQNSSVSSEPLSMYSAALVGNLSRVRFLCENGDIPKWRSAWNPLHAAIRGGHLHVVKYLLSYGKDLPSQFNDASLCLAAGEGHDKVVEILLGEKACVQGTDQLKAALEAAAKNGHSSTTRILLNKISLSTNNGPSLRKTFLFAIRIGDIELIEDFLRMGADMNSFGPEGSALELAVKYGYHDITACLVARGALFGSREYDLKKAVHMGNLDLVELIATSGCKIKNPHLLRGLAQRLGYLAIFKALERCLTSPRDHDRRGPRPTADSNSSDVFSGEQLAEILKFDELSYHPPPLRLTETGRNPEATTEIPLEDFHHSSSEPDTSEGDAEPHSSRFSPWILHQSEAGNITQHLSPHESLKRIGGSRLRREFTRLCRKALQGVSGPKSSSELAAISAIFALPAKLWRTGISTIQNLLQEIPPQQFDQVISCLLVADAMKNSIFRKGSVRWRRASDEFNRDLSRWRSILHSTLDKQMFDEVVLELWGLQDNVNIIIESDVINLRYLQVLMSNLTSTTNVALGATSWRSKFTGGHRLFTLRECSRQSAHFRQSEDFNHEDCWPSGQMSSSSTNCDRSPRYAIIDNVKEPTTRHIWKPLESQCANQIQQQALMLMAGAIFSLILLYLLTVRFKAPQSYDETGQLVPDMMSTNILARNCYFLILFLGLQHAPLPEEMLFKQEEQNPINDRSTSRWAESIISDKQYSPSESNSCSLPFETPASLPMPNTEEQLAGRIFDTPMSSSFNLASDSHSFFADIGEFVDLDMDASTCALYEHIRADGNVPLDFGELTSSPPSRSASGSYSCDERVQENLDKVRPVCLHKDCGKTFSSITNRNKHSKFDCPWASPTSKQKFPCRRGCSKHFSRQSYRDKHETTRCKVLQRSLR